MCTESRDAVNMHRKSKQMQQKEEAAREKIRNTCKRKQTAEWVESIRYERSAERVMGRQRTANEWRAWMSQEDNKNDINVMMFIWTYRCSRMSLKSKNNRIVRFWFIGTLILYLLLSSNLLTVWCCIYCSRKMSALPNCLDANVCQHLNIRYMKELLLPDEHRK